MGWGGYSLSARPEGYTSGTELRGLVKFKGEIVEVVPEFGCFMLTLHLRVCVVFTVFILQDSLRLCGYDYG